MICWDSPNSQLVVNFIQQPLPDGSTTGASISQAGALGQGQRAATGLTTCMYSLYSMAKLETMLTGQSTLSGAT